MRSTYYIALTFIFLFNISTAFSQNYTFKTVVIDPGHGGNKPGSIGKISKEKDVSLKVALLLGQKIAKEMPEIKVIFTRKTDIDVDLFKRAEIANKNNADLFISIHCNAATSTAKGTETIVAGSHRLSEQDAAIRENADIKLEKNYKSNYDGFDPSKPETYIMLSLLKNAFRDKSISFAKLLEQNYVDDKRPSRGVKEQGLLVLQRCGMPAVLTEIGFISNAAEELYINSYTGQHEIANSILNAIKSFKQEAERK